MRNLKQFMLLVMTLSLVSLSSCSKDDDGGSGGSAASGTINAKVDGSDFNSMEISSSATVANSGQNLVIIGSNSSGEAITITIFGYEGVGTYEISGANINISASYSETDVSNPSSPTTEIWQSPYEDSVLGEINISEETDTKVKGTFNFMCKNVGGDNSVKNITDGSFDLNKQIT
ncbi:DUF6252 family protein [Lacinutrix iliipiscaria]|uniref:DUF6252 family protein n=1 Tax=Lacinutrix iliipiscaria TaxID=1230532 RepID=A0ABW5WNT6_9FLAO